MQNLGGQTKSIMVFSALAYILSDLHSLSQSKLFENCILHSGTQIAHLWQYPPGVSLQSLPILRYITYHRTPHIHCQKHSLADQQVCRFSCRKKSSAIVRRNSESSRCSLLTWQGVCVRDIAVLPVAALFDVFPKGSTIFLVVIAQECRFLSNDTRAEGRL